MTRCAAICLAALLVAPADAGARPDLRRPASAGPLTLYPDDSRPDLYYFPPGELAVPSTREGRPDLQFLHVRYTGRVTTGDRGRELYRSLLTFRVVLAGPAPDDIAAARRAIGAAAELRPLPIRRLDTALVYAPLRPEKSETVEEPAPRLLEGGHAQPGEGAAPAGQDWTERVYSLVLGAEDAQLLSAAFERGRVAISLGYAFYADGIGPESPIDELRGSPELVKALGDAVAARTNAKAATSAAGHLVRAGALAVMLDAGRWPELIRKIDVGAEAPPGYAFLDVYCFDFNNELRPDLYEKQVEIEADGVAGRPVRLVAIFQRDSPDVYVRTVRFPAAVRLDKPYRYRTVEISPDGNVTEGPWRARESWTEHLDVTTASSTGGNEL